MSGNVEPVVRLWQRATINAKHLSLSAVGVVAAHSSGYVGTQCAVRIMEPFGIVQFWNIA